METSRSLASKLFLFSLVFLIGLQTAPVLAQTAAGTAAKPDVESVLSSKKVTVGADKKEALTDAKNVKPGEVIEYQVTYTNKGKAAVTGLTASLPIPEGTEFIRASAKPAAGVKATVGDGKFDAIPLKRKVKTPDGKEVEQEVPLAQYKALQWALGELPAGKSTTVTARVRIAEGALTPPASATSPASSSTATPAGGAK